MKITTAVPAFLAASAVIVCAVSACTTVSDVTPMGKDTFMVGAEARGGLMSRTEVAQLAIKRANAFCESQGKEMSPTHIDSTGVRGWTPQETQFVFQCVQKRTLVISARR